MRRSDISGRIVLYARYCLEGGSVRLLEREKKDTVMRTFLIIRCSSDIQWTDSKKALQELFRTSSRI